MEIILVVLELSLDLILTLIRHVLPVPWVADWITGPCLKAFPTDGFSSSDNRKLSEYKKGYKY